MTKFILINGDLIEKQESSKLKEIKQSSNLKEVNITYFKYKLDIIDDIPTFTFQNEILKNSGLGYRVNQLHITNIPNYFIINNGENCK